MEWSPVRMKEQEVLGLRLGGSWKIFLEAAGPCRALVLAAMYEGVLVQAGIWPQGYVRPCGVGVVCL